MLAEISQSERALNALGSIPRCHLASLPTPLEPLSALSEELGVNLFVKRDDLTGLAMGGNKARKLEFIMADVVAQGADCVITWAGMQSNWCRQLAAAACKQGVRPVLVLFKRAGRPSERDGNVLLDLIYGAAIHVVERTQQEILEYSGVREVIDEIAERERRSGYRPYIAPIGGSRVECSMTRPLGAMAYAAAMHELLEQAREMHLKIDSIVFATGSGGMHAGLLAAAKLMADGPRAIGVSVSESRESMRGCVMSIVEHTLAGLCINGERPTVTMEDVIVFDEYIREGYGMLNPETSQILCRIARLEGLLLDPVYTGKAMIGLIDLASKRYFRRGENVVFLHTGGLPALFSYGNLLLQQIGGAL